MPTIQVRITNLPQIRAAFQRSPQKMGRELNKAIRKSVLVIERESKIRTPVDTGYLRASHRTTYAPLQATIEPMAHYAIYVHEGTRRMKARPFLLQGVQTAEARIQGFFTEAVQKVLDEIARESQ